MVVLLPKVVVGVFPVGLIVTWKDIRGRTTSRMNFDSGNYMCL